jgi:hypothetical protein
MTELKRIHIKLALLRVQAGLERVDPEAKAANIARINELLSEVRELRTEETAAEKRAEAGLTSGN